MSDADQRKNTRRKILTIEGVWKSRGYGWYLKVDPAGYAFFDETRDDCIEFERGDRAEFAAGLNAGLDDKKNHLQLHVQNELSIYDFDRRADLPGRVLPLDAPRDFDPRRNFEFFRQAFAQDYAFFKERNVDWDALCQSIDPSIREETPPDALFAALGELIQPLKDNHVSLINGDMIARSEKIGETKALLRRALGLKVDHIGHPDNLALLGKFIQTQYLGAAGKSAGNGAFHWGMLTANVGYLNVFRMFGLHDDPSAKHATDLPPRRCDHANFLRRDLDAIDAILDRVLDDFSGAEAIILDIRLNGGGFDKISLAIANRFADEKRLAFTKEARIDGSLTPRQKFFVEPPSGKQFSTPVYVLTSNRTPSAGDVLALCMRALPHVTLLGQPSTGILSDNLAKHMPNGWRFYLSNELYRSPRGELFEGCGVPVDIETPVFLPSDFVSGYRLAIDTALQHIASNTAPLSYAAITP